MESESKFYSGQPSVQTDLFFQTKKLEKMKDLIRNLCYIIIHI